ncbi:hypothetical protein GCM10009765_21620 [Fodinicola feengrottensis]|uniref:Uncharacterized protein n=1 Tax=Fodinicola feengrottensis TaxID=435914 RepID=A0ABP4SF02_9ACTN
MARDTHADSRTDAGDAPEPTRAAQDGRTRPEKNPTTLPPPERSGAREKAAATDSFQKEKGALADSVQKEKSALSDSVQKEKGALKDAAQREKGAFEDLTG